MVARRRCNSIPCRSGHAHAAVQHRCRACRVNRRSRPAAPRLRRSRRRRFSSVGTMMVRPRESVSVSISSPAHAFEIALATESGASSLFRTTSRACWTPMCISTIPPGSRHAALRRSPPVLVLQPRVPTMIRHRWPSPLRRWDRLAGGGPVGTPRSRATPGWP